MKYLILITALLVTGCGGLDFPSGTLTKEASVFVAEGSARGLDLQTKVAQVEITFARLPGKMAGHCVIPPVGQRYIELDTAFWARSSEDDHLSLVMHELGHCVLNRHHQGPDTQFSVTIMSPSAPTGVWFRLNYAALVEELYPYKE